MSNSPLTTCTVISPNQSGKRLHAVDRITIHCVVGQCTAEALGALFADPKRFASSNYGVDKDGRVGCYVDEDCRSWCSSSAANDDRAVTIETASDSFAPYAVRPAAYAGLLDLCEDICRRNGKTRLLWLGDKETTLAYEPGPDEMVMTVHRWFANKSCPGEYLMARQGEIAAEVTRRLETPQSAAPPAPLAGEPGVASPSPTDEEEDDVKRYNSIEEVPEWGKETVVRLCAAGVLKGCGGERDGDGYPTGLDLSADALRLLVILDRAGAFAACGA